MKNESISLQLNKAKENKFLYESTLGNILELTECNEIPEWIIDSITELLDTENWEELNNRFYKNLAFGTGGMRGRTIGNYVTKAERGKTKGKETPRFAAVGSNTLNEITVLREENLELQQNIIDLTTDDNTNSTS